MIYYADYKFWLSLSQSERAERYQITVCCDRSSGVDGWRGLPWLEVGGQDWGHSVLSQYNMTPLYTCNCRAHWGGLASTSLKGVIWILDYCTTLSSIRRTPDIFDVTPLSRENITEALRIHGYKFTSFI